MIADLSPAFVWTCDACGRENLCRLPERTLDPADPSDRHELCRWIERDLMAVYDRLGAGGRIMSKGDAARLRAAARSGRGGTCLRYSRRYVPDAVTCRNAECGRTFPTGRVVNVEEFFDSTGDIYLDGDD